MKIINSLYNANTAIKPIKQQSKYIKRVITEANIPADVQNSVSTITNWIKDKNIILKISDAGKFSDDIVNVPCSLENHLSDKVNLQIFNKKMHPQTKEIIVSRNDNEPYIRTIYKKVEELYNDYRANKSNGFVEALKEIAFCIKG